MAASASSYASSTVCGTIERSSCSRSQGHSTRSRRVISSRRARLARAPSSTVAYLVSVLVDEVPVLCGVVVWTCGEPPEAGAVDDAFCFGAFAQSGITYALAHFVLPL